MLSAAFGVGGAVVSTPAIRALGASAFIAVGTTLPSILPSAVTGTLRYAREGLIDRRVVALTAPVGIAASVAGSALSKVLPGDGHWLMLLTAALLGFTAWRMGRTPEEQPLEGDDAALADERANNETRPGVLVGIGAVSGAMSGLLGVGGGIVMVPAFSEIVGMPVKAAIGTSLACVGIFAIPGTITHALFGDIDWRFALFLALGVVPGARLGAAAAIRARDHRLRLAVALFLGAVAIAYAAGEVLALAS